MKKNYTAATLKHLISSLRAIMLYQISGNAIPQLPWTPEALCGGNDTRGFVPVSSCCVCLFVKSSLQCVPVSDILILGLMTTNNYPENWEVAANCRIWNIFREGRSLFWQRGFLTAFTISVCLFVLRRVLLCECECVVGGREKKVACCRVTLSVLVHMAWGSRRCLWRASLSTSSSATLPLQQGFPHTNGWIFLRASIANH